VLTTRVYLAQYSIKKKGDGEKVKTISMLRELMR
jgi:hypothetical protein